MVNVPEQARWTVSLDTVSPGWLRIPTLTDSDAREQWIAERTDDLRGMWEKDWQEGYEAAVPEQLRAAAEERLASDVSMLFQIWPVRVPATVMCRVAILVNDTVYPWNEWSGVAHRVEAPHVGPGVQYTHHRYYVDEDGQRTDLFSLAFVFDDGESLLVVTLQESPAPAISAVLEGFIGLLDTLRMETADGTPFVSREPKGILDDGPWRLEDAG